MKIQILRNIYNATQGNISEKEFLEKYLEDKKKSDLEGNYIKEEENED